jgi:hypothetical protein
MVLGFSISCKGEQPFFNLHIAFPTSHNDFAKYSYFPAAVAVLEVADDST